MARDAVTPEIRDAVFARDREIVGDLMAEYSYTTKWEQDRLIVSGLGTQGFFRHSRIACPAAVIDLNQLGLCWGRWTLEHVPDTMTMKMGMLIRGMSRAKRAPSDLAHLIALCEGHTEPGMKGGYVWNLANRPAIRAYLEQANA